jgi:hypothetical protein
MGCSAATSVLSADCFFAGLCFFSWLGAINTFFTGELNEPIWQIDYYVIGSKSSGEDALRALIAQAVVTPIRTQQ